jgi:hypothetical protein
MDASKPRESSALPAQAGGGGMARNPLVGAQVPLPPNADVADQTGADDPVWIEKARQVIKRSTGDPYVRHDAINKLKVQYLKQRFGKSIGDKAE